MWTNHVGSKYCVTIGLCSGDKDLSAYEVTVWSRPWENIHWNTKSVLNIMETYAWWIFLYEYNGPESKYCVYRGCVERWWYGVVIIQRGLSKNLAVKLCCLLNPFFPMELLKFSHTQLQFFLRKFRWRNKNNGDRTVLISDSEFSLIWLMNVSIDSLYILNFLIENEGEGKFNS